MTTNADIVVLAEFQCLCGSAQRDLCVDIVATLLTSLLVDQSVGLEFVFGCNAVEMLLDKAAAGAEFLRAYGCTDLEAGGECILQSVRRRSIVVIVVIIIVVVAV